MEGADQKKEGAFCVWTQDEIAALLSGPLSSSDEQTLSHLFCFFSMHVHVCVHLCMNVCVRACMHAYVRAFVHVYMHACLHVYCARACVNACVCVYICVYTICVYTRVMYFFFIVYCLSSRCHGHQDPHKKLLGKNVLIVCKSLEKTAEHFKMAEEEVGRLLTGTRETLFREWLS